MRLQKPESRRSGAAVVEAAVIVPVVLLILFGIISGAVLVFSADEVSNVAREGTRYGSVRGTTYAFETKRPPATADEIKAFVKQQAVMLDPSRMTVTVTWQGTNRPGNYITVEVHYQFPGLAIFGAREFVSKSTAVMTY